MLPDGRGSGRALAQSDADARLVGEGQGLRLENKDAGILALVAATVLAFLWRLCLAGQILFGPDAFAYFYPMYEYAAQRLTSGALPLWNPYLFLGAPFLANPQAGVFYPVHWALAWLPAPSLASASLAIHYTLAAGSMYLLARLGLGHRRLPALAAGLVFGLSGLLGAQAEHFNQVETLAWLPLQVLALEVGALRPSTSSGTRRLWLLAAAILSTTQLLAGHSQAAYIAHATLVAYATVRVLAGGDAMRASASRWGRAVLFIGFAAATGAALSAVQLLPTLELSRVSVRAEGLSYRQAVSFSFGPRSWLLGLLPHYGSEAPFSEYVAHVGVTGLGLALLGALRKGRRRWWAVGLVMLGVFLALGGYNPFYYVLYRLLPGMDLFRAPARWLVMSLLGASLLVAEGAEALGAEWRFAVPRWWRSGYALVVAAAVGLLWLVADPRPQPVTVIGWVVTGLVFAGIVRLLPPRMAVPAVTALLVIELFAASQGMPYNQTTAPSVYAAQRRSTQVLTRAAGLSRFLTVSDPRFDPGDMAELVATLGQELTAEGRYGLIVGAKSQEVLSRNLALKWGLFAVDGYDGGVLPTLDHLAFQSLYLPSGGVAADGRMSEALEAVPAERLLALASIGFLLEDRLEDMWLDGVYYDLGYDIPFGSGSSGVAVAVPRFPATELGLVVAVPEGETAGEGRVWISLDGEVVAEVVWRDGQLALEARGRASVPMEPIAERPGLYHAVMPLGSTARYFSGMEVLPFGDMRAGSLAAASLINSAADVGVPIALSQVSGIVPVHLGDLQVSRVERSLPRAYFTSCTVTVPGRDEALEVLQRPSFDPRQATVLIGDEGAACEVEGWSPAEVVSYLPERVVVEVDAPRPGYLVLTDSFYPGWQAEVDGASEEVERANWFFRAVPVETGRHQIEFVYHSSAVQSGAIVSGLTAAGLMVAVGIAIRFRSR